MGLTKRKPFEDVDHPKVVQFLGWFKTLKYKPNFKLEAEAREYGVQVLFTVSTIDSTRPLPSFDSRVHFPTVAFVVKDIKGPYFAERRSPPPRVNLDDYLVDIIHANHLGYEEIIDTDPNYWQVTIWEWLQKIELHEAGEFFQVGHKKPYFPEHFSSLTENADSKGSE